jgi:AraC-like DNA-binding protein
MDVLSEVLRAVKLDGAFFYNGEFSAPWGFRAPESRKIVPYLRPKSGHIITYHLLTEGRAFAGLEHDRMRISLEAGDIVFFPHGDSHILENGSPPQRVDNEKELASIFSQGLKLSRGGGGGEVSRFVCGYMCCDPQLSEVFLSGLPPVVKVRIRSDEAGEWIENSIRLSVGALGGAPAGGEAVLTKLSEVLFVETLRRYIHELPPEQTGWLAGARDPLVGRALAHMHREPALPWTIASLAEKVGASRSVLAQRFSFFLGEPPMSYLTRWRMQLGAQQLCATSRSVAEIAGDVGYESEAAFTRAFKREFGKPPARYRTLHKSAPA